MTTPPRCREKVMVYYYYITNIRIRIRIRGSSCTDIRIRGSPSFDSYMCIRFRGSRNFGIRYISITYYVLLIKALKGHRNFNILVIFILSFVFLHMLSSKFFCVMGSVFIYIIKFIIEINTVIKVAHK